MSAQKSPQDAPVRPIDQILAFTALGLIALSVICFFSIIIGTAVGMQQSDFATGIWPIAAAIPLWGLPLGFVLIVVLLITSFIRKGRAAKRSQ